MAAVAEQVRADHAAWPDVDEVFEAFADDATLDDPTSGDNLVRGEERIVQLYRGMAAYFPDLEIESERLFLSADGFVDATSIPNLGPPFGTREPPDPPPARAADAYHLDGDVVTEYRLYHSPDILAPANMACFAVDGCPALQSWVDRYVSAWTSSDADQVADLYAGDASFQDGKTATESHARTCTTNPVRCCDPASWTEAYVCGRR